MADWKPIETAPLDGTDIQARIPGHGEDNVIAWQADAEGRQRLISNRVRTQG